ncbi:MAG TPA: sulfotransferase, partial [Anaerolineales bacterium]|nr:sulfotransferase [Anaerolineales bacterium]
MMPSDRRPILVTGAHRTGTTWVGRLLAAAPDVSYVSEPLNVLHRPGVFGAPVTKWYTYVCDDNAAGFLPAYKDLLSFRYHLGSELLSLRSPRDVGRMGRDTSVFLRGSLRHNVPLLKDPFAVFSVEWFARVLQCRIAVTVRHPAAFASGLKRLGWSFDFQDLLRQPLLMRDHLSGFEDAMTSDDAREVVGQASLLWKMIYK